MNDEDWKPDADWKRFMYQRILYRKAKKKLLDWDEWCQKYKTRVEILIEQANKLEEDNEA